MKILKKDLYAGIKELNASRLNELSNISKYVNFKTGSKTFLRTLIKDATTQEELKYFKEYIENLTFISQTGEWGLVQQYTEMSETFRIANYYLDQSGLTVAQKLKFFELYENTLYAVEDSEDVEKMTDEFIFNQTELESVDNV